MLFSSQTFLFIFLPIVLIFYFISKDRYKNIILLLASLVFYSWGEPKYIILVVVSIIVNYLLALWMSKVKKNKLIFVISLLFNVALLMYFKYFNFVVDIFNSIFNISLSIKTIVLPLGISFYTFQILSYVIDVYRKKVKVQKNIINLATYVLLFPQLIAGPIVRYETIEDELKERKITTDNVVVGLKRFIIGLGKKVIIANNVGFLADTILSDVSSIGTAAVWFGILSYSLQIYFDFSGYSDMAIGLGKVLGFNFLENFNYPYIATSITDFWRRWHISLSSWFKDYIYIPLGGNRVSKIKWIRNILIVWALTGLWHGANWNFIIWGLYFGIILLIEKLFLAKLLEKLPKLVKWIYSFLLINIGWVIFRQEDISTMLLTLKKMFVIDNLDLKSFIANNYGVMNYIPYFIIGIILMFPLVSNLYNKLKDKHIVLYALFDIIIILIFVLSVCFLIQSTYNPFIYFRF